MIRSRLLLVVVIVLLAVSPGHLIAQSSTEPSGTTVLESSGTPGTFQVGFSVGTCRHTAAGGTRQVSVEIPGPAANAKGSGSNQTIEWQPLVFQRFPDTRAPQVVRTGTLQSQAVPAGASTTFTREVFTELPEGPGYAAGGTLTWKSGSTVTGTTRFLYENYQWYNGPSASLSTGYCPPVAPAELSLSTTRTTVNVTVRISGRYFPISAPVTITWDGKTLATVTSDVNGTVSGSVRVPAAPMGDHRLGFDAGSWWKVTSTLTIVPRIKVIPDEAGRGETVKISLRGFGKKEVVRIRWKKGNSWVEVGRVTTSSTGSGELYLPVPSWVPDGLSSVRGDGSIGRAQTNAVTISGGARLTLASEASPTPTPTNAASPAASPTASNAAASPTDASTETPTATVPIDPGTMTPTETMTETAGPSETVPVTETASPTETAIATETETVTETVTETSAQPDA